MKETKEIKSLRATLNSAPFRSAEWNAASEKLHAITIKDIESKPAKLPANWCTSDGEWWM